MQPFNNSVKWLNSLGIWNRLSGIRIQKKYDRAMKK